MPQTFADLGVPAPLCEQLARRGINEAFPIQAATLPDALAGRDLCGRAPTGSGKTIAFGLAIAARVSRAQPHQPRALVLVPTRELATQVAGEIQSLLPRSSKLGVATIFGGTGYGAQRKALARGAAIVVACPGRLEDLVEQQDVHLDQVDLVVLDEADRMADMGFLPAVKRLLDQTSSKRQTLLFSATLDNEIDSLVRRYQRDPARHDVTPHAEAADVEHSFWKAERSQHVGLTAALVQHHGRALVFCRTRRGVDRVTKQLRASGVHAVPIHGNRTQGQRERALAAFDSGKADALVATDVAARGIHVDHVACVVHFDLPADPKDYVHRSGRTGRAGATGTVVSLIPSEQVKVARKLQKTLGLPPSVDSPTMAPARPSAPVTHGADEATSTRPGRPGRPKASGTPQRRRRPAQHRSRTNGNGSSSNNGSGSSNGNGSRGTGNRAARRRNKPRSRTNTARWS